MKSDLQFRGAVLAVFFLSPVVSCRECVDALNAPTGTSTMSAEINGVHETFTDVHPVNYFGFSVSASSASNRIRLSLGYAVVGHYEWRKHKGGYLVADTSAFLNLMPALEGIGGSTVTRSDNGRRVVEGVFDFAVVDTAGQDTIRVTNGVFTLFHAAED